MDICLRYGDVILGIELKVWKTGRPTPLKAGLEQLDRYLAGLRLDTGWLVIFDQRQGQPPICDGPSGPVFDHRTRTEIVTSPAQRQITVIWA